jgi:hypothetical protein
MHDTGCRIQDSGLRIKDTGYGMRAARCLTAAILAVWFGSMGCGRSPAVNESAIDLGERFSLIESGGSKALDRHVEVIRKGRRHEAFILVAPAVIRASLQGALKEMTLNCLAAPVFDVGDGIQMSVFLERAGTRIPVGNRYFDPGRKAEDRDWIPTAIPISISRGDQLEIEVSAGPQGDLVADWLALSSIRLTPR